MARYLMNIILLLSMILMTMCHAGSWNPYCVLKSCATEPLLQKEQPKAGLEECARMMRQEAQKPEYAEKPLVHADNPNWFDANALCEDMRQYYGLPSFRDHYFDGTCKDVAAENQNASNDVRKLPTFVRDAIGDPAEDVYAGDADLVSIKLIWYHTLSVLKHDMLKGSPVQNTQFPSELDELLPYFNDFAARYPDAEPPAPNSVNWRTDCNGLHRCIHGLHAKILHHVVRWHTQSRFWRVFDSIIGADYDPNRLQKLHELGNMYAFTKAYTERDYSYFDIYYNGDNKDLIGTMLMEMMNARSYAVSNTYTTVEI